MDWDVPKATGTGIVIIPGIILLIVVATARSVIFSKLPTSDELIAAVGLFAALWIFDRWAQNSLAQRKNQERAFDKLESDLSTVLTKLEDVERKIARTRES